MLAGLGFIGAEGSVPAKKMREMSAMHFVGASDCSRIDGGSCLNFEKPLFEGREPATLPFELKGIFPLKLGDNKCSLSIGKFFVNSNHKEKGK